MVTRNATLAARAVATSAIVILALTVAPEATAAPPSVRAVVVAGNGDSTAPAVSGDGRYVAFQSRASNLVPKDTNGAIDVFVRDRMTSRTTRISVSSTGRQGNGDSFDPAISADGRSVVFTSLATNFVRRDTNGVADVFVHDLRSGSTRRVSVSTAGVQANGYSQLPDISADGSTVVFASVATNLVPADTNSVADIFRRTLTNGQTVRVSVPSVGAQSDGSSWVPAVSGDGARVAFWSSGRLTPPPVRGLTDWFGIDVRDRVTRTTRLVLWSDAEDTVPDRVQVADNLGRRRQRRHGERVRM